MTDDRDPSSNTATAAWIAIVVGALLFAVAMGIAFTPGNSGGNGLAMVAIILMVLGAVVNIIATGRGIFLLVAKRRFRWWWPISLLVSAGTACAIWMVIHL